MDSDGQLTLHRSGIQDQLAGGLLDRLREFKSEIGRLDPSTSTPLGHTYLSTEVTGRQLVPGTRIRLEFYRSPNKNEGEPRVWDAVRAHSGCNQLGTAAAAGELLTDGKLWLQGVGGTQMRCEPALQAQEEWLKTFLTSRPSWHVDGDQLTLTADGTTITLLDKKLAEPDLPLDGTRWNVLTTITNADLRYHRSQADPAWISFDGDRLTGWTGCNELSGTVTRTNTELNFTDVTITNHTCPGETADVEAAILTTLATTATYTIDHNTMVLINPAGVGLDLTAN
ncbi:META domain-containing protein [Kribbella sp. NPDC058693]|uniref:META domain-containing protein n=1 Tax=Kribbella sp. NPDC058693 TaxID=3346602 RepID=UPI003661E0AE